MTMNAPATTTQPWYSDGRADAPRSPNFTGPPGGTIRRREPARVVGDGWRRASRLIEPTPAAIMPHATMTCREEERMAQHGAPEQAPAPGSPPAAFPASDLSFTAERRALLEPKLRSLLREFAELEALVGSEVEPWYARPL